MPIKFIYAVFVCIIALGSSTSAQAKESTWVISAESRARIISGVQSIGRTLEIEAALELDIADGWHSYWKNPGDSGLPLRFGWDKSTNIKDVQVGWPVPQRKIEQGLFTVFSYSDKVTFPLKITLDEGETDTTLDLNLQFMVCKDICIPAGVDVKIDLESGDGRPSAQARLIELAQRKVPATGDVPYLKIDTVVAGKDTLVISAQSDQGFKNSDLFAFIEGDIAFTSPLEMEEQEEGRALIKVKAPENIENLNEYLSGKTLSLTLANGRKAIEKQISF